MSKPLCGLHILLVEDESMVLMLVEDMLLELGASVQTAMSVKEGERAAAAATLDFAILDVNLAGEKSYSIAMLLRTRGVPVLFATGYGSRGHDAEWQTAPTIAKPFKIEALAAGVGLVLPSHGQCVGS